MKFVIILSILFLFSSAYAQVNELYNKKADDEIIYEVIPQTLPVEFSLLFDAYWTIDFYSQLQNDKNKSMHWLRQLDWNFNQIPKEYLFRIIKTEIEKYILSLKGDIKVPTFFSKQLLVDFQKYIANNEKFMSPFEKAFSIALYHDYEQLLSSSFYPTLQVQLREFKRLSDPELIFLRKKLTNIAQVMTNLMNTENVERDELIQESVKEIIHNIFIKAQTFNQLTALEIAAPPKALHFFRIKPKPQDLSQIVDNTLAELKKKKEAEVVEINWDELPLIPTPIPGYKPPKELPKPLNDWISKIPENRPINNLLVIPTPDPNYQAPSTLPTPLGPPGVWPEE